MSLALVVGACGGGLGTASKAPSSRPSATARIGSVTARPSSTAKPTADPNALAVKVTAHSKSVSRGGTASVAAKTIANADCGISVNYPAGPSSARGLEPAKAPKSGSITWTWKVATNTPKGTWPIVVSCTQGTRYGETSTTFTVK